MIRCTVCFNANAFGSVCVEQIALGEIAYAMRCKDDALHACQTAAQMMCAHNTRGRWYLLVILLVLAFVS